MKRSETITKLAESLANAAHEFPAIGRGCTAKVNVKAGGSYTYNYADLDDILSAVRKPLAKNGLTLSHDCVVVTEELKDNEGSYWNTYVDTTATLLHASGEWMETSPFRVKCDGTMAAAQLVGSGSTYGKRYTSQNILGLSTEQDDDGNAAAGNDASTGKREAPPNCPKCGNNTNVVRGRADLGGGWLCWNKPDANKHGCGAKWTDEAKPAEVNTEARNTILPALAKAAAEGMAAFDRAWKGCTADERKSCVNDMPALKKKAEGVDIGIALLEWNAWFDTSPKLDELNAKVAKDIVKMEDGPVKIAVWNLVQEKTAKAELRWDAKARMFSF